MTTEPEQTTPVANENRDAGTQTRSEAPYDRIDGVPAEDSPAAAESAQTDATSATLRGYVDRLVRLHNLCLLAVFVTALVAVGVDLLQNPFPSGTGHPWAYSGFVGGLLLLAMIASGVSTYRRMQALAVDEDLEITSDVAGSAFLRTKRFAMLAFTVAAMFAAGGLVYGRGLNWAVLVGCGLLLMVTRANLSGLLSFTRNVEEVRADVRRERSEQRSADERAQETQQAETDAPTPQTSDSCEERD